MTWNDIETKWLSPAVEHKELDKQTLQRSPVYRRLPIGEKGVGRFATEKLGHRLELVTRAAAGPELVVECDWDRWDAAEYLDEVEVVIRERDPEVFVGPASGTRLVITQLRDRWNWLHVRALQTFLRRLQSPLSEWPDFRISLQCPEHPDFENINTSDILQRAHYIFRGRVDERGTFDFAYQCRLPQIPARTHTDDACDLAVRARARHELGNDPVTEHPKAATREHVKSGH